MPPVVSATLIFAAGVVVPVPGVVPMPGVVVVPVPILGLVVAWALSMWALLAPN